MPNLARSGGRLLAAATLCVVLSPLGACDRAPGDRADPDFAAVVERPAYPAGEGPRVLIDEAHRNRHRAGGTYAPLARLLEADGYRVARGRELFDREVLRDVDVLVIAGALGTNERNDDSAFLVPECNAVEDWVEAGGSLLLITDHYPFGHAAEQLGLLFGVAMSKGMVEDQKRHDPAFDPTHIVYSAEDGGLADHPIIRGRGPDEAVRKVLTFTGQALWAPPPAVGFLTLLRSARDLPAIPSVSREGGTIRVTVAHGDPELAEGLYQGVALEHGKGRVVVLGEAAMSTAQLSRYDERPFGMNVPGYDNRQLALNIVRWLSGAI